MKNSLTILWLAFVLIAPSTLTAGESETKSKNQKPKPAAGQTPADYARALTPQRNLKFDVAETERDVPLYLVQQHPPLFEQRYVATFRLDLPKDEEGRIRAIPLCQPYQNYKLFDGLPQKYDPNCVFRNASLFLFSSLDNFQRSLLLSVDVASSVEISSWLSGDKSKNHLTEIKPFYYRSNPFPTKQEEGASNMPPAVAPGMRPSGPMAPYRPGAAPPFGVGPGGLGGLPPSRPGTGRDELPDGPTDLQGILVQIFAPSSEDAKKRAETWLDLYDRHLCYPALLQLRKAEELLEQCSTETNDQLQLVKQEGDKLSEQLEKYKEFQDLDREAVGSLKTQRRMLAVDLTGVEARLTLAGKMLERQSRVSQRNEQIESIMIAAQIEQVGLRAKCKELDRLIQGMELRHEILKKSQLNESTRVHLSNIIRLMRGDLHQVEDYQQNFLPLPVHEGRVEIRRIKWAAPTEPK